MEGISIKVLEKIAHLLCANSESMQLGDKMAMLHFFFAYGQKFKKQHYTDFAFEALEEILSAILPKMISPEGKSAPFDLEALEIGRHLQKFVSLGFFETDELNELLAPFDAMAIQKAQLLPRECESLEDINLAVSMASYLIERGPKAQLHLTANNTEKRRIFMVNQGDDSQRFGVGKYISEMIDAVKKQDDTFEMVVVTIGSQAKLKVEISHEKNITYFNLPSPFLQKQELIYGLTKEGSHSLFLILMDFFRISETDIFHFNSNIQHFLLLKIREFTPAKIVYTVHVSMWNVLYKNNEEEFLSEWNDSDCYSIPKKNILAEIESCRQADKVIGLSNNTFNDLKKYYDVPGDKLKRIYNGINTTPPQIQGEKMEYILKKIEIGPQDVVFLFAGRLNEQKGISDLVETFETLQQSGYDHLKLLVVGDGPLKGELESRTEGSKHSIFFLGYVPQNEIHYYYKLADVIVIPSLFDQNPYTILEAMAFKVPMIVTDIDAFETLEAESVCLKVPLETETKVNIFELVMNMQRLIESPGLRTFLVENAHAMLLQNFSSDTMFDNTYNLETSK